MGLAMGRRTSGLISSGSMVEGRGWAASGVFNTDKRGMPVSFAVFGAGVACGGCACVYRPAPLGTGLEESDLAL